MKLVQHFPYRKGFVKGKNVLEFPREAMASLEDYLAKLANVRKDNHVCYLVKDIDFSGSQTKAIMFHDMVCFIGDRVDKWES
jgi:hypothetical protein